MTLRLTSRRAARRAATLAAVAGAGLVAAALPAVAQIGGAAVVFLQIEPDSRSAGMGNTGVALADNANAVFWNPAGLAQQKGGEVGFTHSAWLPELDADLAYEYATAKYNVPGLATFGAHVTYLNLGKHTWTDADGTTLGEFRSYDMAVGLSAARNVTKNLAVGVSGRFIYSNLAPGVEIDGEESQAGTAVAADLGLLYGRNVRLGGIDTRLALGASLANFGPTISYSKSDTTDGDPIPTNLRFGWASTFKFDEFNTLTIANDFNKALYRVELVRDSVGGRPNITRKVDSPFKALVSAWKPIMVDIDGDNEYDPKSVGALEQTTMSIGAEYWYNRRFALRTGFFYESPYNGNRKFVTLGAGVRYNIAGFDLSYIYALEENSPLANTLRFSILLNFLR